MIKLKLFLPSNTLYRVFQTEEDCHNFINNYKKTHIIKSFTIYE